MAKPKVDLSVQVGGSRFANPVMTASGTAGHGAELSAYGPLDQLGAVVVKSLSHSPWPGNLAPRVMGTSIGMVNSVGLQGPGLEHWLEVDLPALVAKRATVVASIWGEKVDDYEKAADLLKGQSGIAALEVNVSCPNLEDGSKMFAQSPSATKDVIEASCRSGISCWAKLSAQVGDIVEVATAAITGGAVAVTLINTLPALVLDPKSHKPIFRGIGGGLSGPALHPVALRQVHTVREAFPDLSIVGVGGIMGLSGALDFLFAGADAFQIGTATFVNPRTPFKVLEGLKRWCVQHGVSRLTDLRGQSFDLEDR